MPHENRSHSPFFDRWGIALLLLAGVALAPAPAYAHVLWDRIIISYFWHAVYGLVAGLFLARLFRVRFARAIPLMILAALVSRIIEARIAVWCKYHHPWDASLFDMWKVALFVHAAILVAMILPAWLLIKWLAREKSWSLCLLTAVLMQTILFGIVVVKNASFRFHLKPDAQQVSDVASRTANKDAVLYYIDADNTGVFQKRLGGDQEPARVHELDTAGRPWLWLRAKPDRRCDLVLDVGTRDYKVILEDVSECMFDQEDQEDYERWGDLPLIFPDAVDALYYVPRGVVPAAKWKRYAFEFHETGAEDRHRLNIWTPFFITTLHNLVALPGDEVLLESENKIYLYWPGTKELGVVADGRSPCIALEGHVPYKFDIF